MLPAHWTFLSSTQTPPALLRCWCTLHPYAAWLLVQRRRQDPMQSCSAQQPSCCCVGCCRGCQPQRGLSCCFLCCCCWVKRRTLGCGRSSRAPQESRGGCWMPPSGSCCCLFGLSHKGTTPLLVRPAAAVPVRLWCYSHSAAHTAAAAGGRRRQPVAVLAAPAVLLLPEHWRQQQRQRRLWQRRKTTAVKRSSSVVAEVPRAPQQPQLPLKHVAVGHFGPAAAVAAVVEQTG